MLSIRFVDVSVVVTFFVSAQIFLKDALIVFKICRNLNHCIMQIKFDIGNHPQNLAELCPIFFSLIFYC